MGIETATAVPFPKPGITPTMYPSRTPKAIQEILLSVKTELKTSKLIDFPI